MLDHALRRMSAAGISVTAADGDLVVKSPNPLSDAQRQFLRDHKAELLAMLSAEIRATIWRVWTPAPGGGFYEVDAIRRTPVSAREVLAEFPDAAEIQPRLPKGESIMVEGTESAENVQ